MRLSSHDASFLYTETASGPMHGIAITVLEGAPGYQEIYDYYAARIHRVQRLRQRLMFVPFNLAHPKWVDDPAFDLANHMKRHVVPPTTTVARATEIGLELGEPLLDRSRPLWLTYVIENVQGKTVIVQITHHAFVDGATAVAISIALTDNAPDAPPPPPPDQPWRPARLPTPMELWTEAVAENARIAAEQMQRSMRSGMAPGVVDPGAARLIERMLRPVMQAPWNASLVGPKRRFINLEYRLDAFKPIRKGLGGTINDIVVSVVAEGAARYLAGKGEVVEGQHLRLMCPVNVRDEDDDPLDMRGNKVSAMFPIVAAWPMRIEERYLGVRAELDEIKENDEAGVMYRLQESQPNVPPVAMAQTLNVGTPWDPTVAAARAPLPILPHTGGPRPQQSGFNFTVTNVAGPSWRQFVAGHAVLSTVGTLMLGGNLGLGVGVVSYNGTFNISFTADPRLLPDLKTFSGHVAEAFDELKALARAQSP
jgi:diacylglycerol O-acyltransferase / wax synthase